MSTSVLEDLLPVIPRNAPAAEVVTVKFEDPCRNRGKRKIQETEKTPVPSKSTKLSSRVVKPDKKAIKQEWNALHADVHKYTLEGMTREERIKSEQIRLIKLGAEPPKRKNINYKELMIKKAAEKIQASEDRTIARLQGINIKKNAVPNQDPIEALSAKKKKKNEVAKKIFGSEKFDDASDGQIGKYNKGMQVISSTQLKKIKPVSSKSFKL